MVYMPELEHRNTWICRLTAVKFCDCTEFCSGWGEESVEYDGGCGWETLNERINGQVKWLREVWSVYKCIDSDVESV
jgi:hypothetical protein